MGRRRQNQHQFPTRIKPMASLRRLGLSYGHVGSATYNSDDKQNVLRPLGHGHHDSIIPATKGFHEPTSDLNDQVNQLIHQHPELAPAFPLLAPLVSTSETLPHGRVDGDEEWRRAAEGQESQESVAVVKQLDQQDQLEKRAREWEWLYHAAFSEAR
ncbi:MAG: hypothetical protein M1823_005760 [Watsoniomyces obsoletus]|nr:MAG: hypothetical protein M1823_005760 [Watsoniomyces obsoletus]